MPRRETGRRTKLFGGRDAAPRRPDGAARRPHQGKRRILSCAPGNHAHLFLLAFTGFSGSFMESAAGHRAAFRELAPEPALPAAGQFSCQLEDSTSPRPSSIRLRRAYGGQGRGRMVCRHTVKPLTALAGQPIVNPWPTMAIPSPIRWERVRVRAIVIHKTKISGEARPHHAFSSIRLKRGVKCQLWSCSCGLFRSLLRQKPYRK
jgi:hypothetical protein